MAEDPRQAAARYRVDRVAEELGFAKDAEPRDAASDVTAGGESEAPPRAPTAQERAAYVETAIQQAIRRGDFDNLPGSGKPLEGLSDRHDPDWWIRRKIEAEQLRGLGPPALTLRVEHAEMEQRLDELRDESDVRESVHDFNRRVIEARRQLLGGPPVVTPTRDVEAEVAAWHERRTARAASDTPSVAPARRRLFRRGSPR